MQHLGFARPRLALAVILVAALGAAGGCGSGSHAYPVSGKVVFEDGQPATELVGGMVTFNSNELKTSSIGAIEAGGTFRLSTDRKNDGALPGKYQVSVTNPLMPDGRTPKSIIEERSSGQLVIVEAKNNDVTLSVKRTHSTKK